MSREHRLTVLRMVGLAALYAAGAQLGLALQSPHDHVTVVWPPTGIALAALVLYGSRLWPGIFAGALIANVLDGVAFPVAAGIAVGNTIAPLVAARLLRHLDVRPRLERLRDVILLAFAGGMVAMVISATLGTLVLSLSGDGGFYVWRLWWVGDAMGVILVAPLLLTVGARTLSGSRLVRHPRAAVGILGLLTAVTLLAVLTESPIGYLVIPVAIWAAIHLEQEGAAAAALIMSVIDIWHTSVAPSPNMPVEAQLMTLQGINATIALILLGFAAVMHERRRAEGELRSAAIELEDRVRSRTAALARTNERLEQEIVDRRATEHALRSSEARLAEAQRLAHIGSFTWDAAADRNEWSDELFQIYGLRPDDGPPGFEEYISFVREDTRPAMRAAVEAAIASGDPLGHEYPIVLDDGTRKWVHAYIEIVKDEDGNLLGLRGTCQDITDRKVSEGLVRFSEQRFRTLLESAPDAVVVVDPKGAIQLMNAQTARLFGYERDELIGQNVDLLLPPQVRNAHAGHRGDYAAAPATRPMGAGGDLYAVKKDGTRFPVDISLSPVETEGGFLVFALVRDASDRRHNEEALRDALDREKEASEHLRQLDQAKNAFLSAVSHELRTPLTAIIGFAELLRDEDVRRSDEMTVDLVERLDASANRLVRLLSDLLDIDRLQRGILEPRRRPTHLYNLVERALTSLETGSHPLTVDVADAVVVIDPAHTERIVENLVNNAMKYTPSGTPITLRATATEDDGVEIVVSDAGPGITEEIRRTIFEPFVRGDTGSFTQGTGIGLALVERFARLHGGRAWVEESPTGGAAFHVLLAGPNAADAAVA